MTKGELLDALQEMDPDTEIRFASQPSWPFEYSIHDIVIVDDEPEQDDCEESTQIVYLVEGRQIGYLPHEAKEEIGW